MKIQSDLKRFNFDLSTLNPIEIIYNTWYLLEIFWEIVIRIGELMKVDCMELFDEMIRDNQRAEEITRLFSQCLRKNLLHEMSTPLQCAV